MNARRRAAFFPKDDERKRDHKGGAVAFSHAFSPNRATMQVYQLLGNGESEP
jgi:hypothetical protein